MKTDTDTSERTTTLPHWASGIFPVWVRDDVHAVFDAMGSNGFDTTPLQIAVLEMLCGDFQKCVAQAVDALAWIRRVAVARRGKAAVLSDIGLEENSDGSFAPIGRRIQLSRIQELKDLYRAQRVQILTRSITECERELVDLEAWDGAEHLKVALDKHNEEVDQFRNELAERKKELAGWKTRPNEMLEMARG